MSTIHTSPSSSPSDSKIFDSRLAASTLKSTNGAELRLPTESEVLQLKFASAPTGESGEFRFGSQQQQVALPIKRFTTSSLNASLLHSDASLSLILIPHNNSSSSIDLIHSVQTWIDATSSSDSIASSSAKSILLTLQGVHIVWQPRRAVIFADSSRMEQICQSLIEATYFEQELRQIELEIDRGWEQTQRDSTFAFEFNERSLIHKDALKERFQFVLGLRVALARLTPQVLVPHVYPPTIASQIGERLRERTRMPERLTLVDERLNAQERIYDHCVQRTSEYMVARKGHILEWVIIILLLIQTIFWVIQLLSSTGQ